MEAVPCGVYAFCLIGHKDLPAQSNKLIQRSRKQIREIRPSYWPDFSFGIGYVVLEGGGLGDVVGIVLK